MERTLYVETNFPVGIAKGQDLAAASFLSGDSTDIRLVIPSVCYMEAFSVWEREQKQTNRLIDSMAFQIREVKRNAASVRAQRLGEHLDGARFESEQLLYEMRERLDEALLRLSEDADFIDIEHTIVHDALAYTHVSDPTDNLILCSILWHARRNPVGPKAFLSRNYKDFGQQNVCDLLLSADVQYFKNTEAALGWIRSQSPT